MLLLTLGIDVGAATCLLLLCLLLMVLLLMVLLLPLLLFLLLQLLTCSLPPLQRSQRHGHRSHAVLPQK